MIFSNRQSTLKPASRRIVTKDQRITIEVIIISKRGDSNRTRRFLKKKQIDKVY